MAVGMVVLGAFKQSLRPTFLDSKLALVSLGEGKGYEKVRGEGCPLYGAAAGS